MATELSHLEQAGNHGDVLKHAVLQAAIKAQQEAHPEGIIFVDTHCGPGMYDLGEQSSGEYEKGIMKIAANIDDAPKPVADYFNFVKANDEFLQQYPGSPIIAEGLLRDVDEHRLCDLHVEQVQGVKNSPVMQQGDSFHPEAYHYFLPKSDKHPVIFIDPSYVDTEDFFRARQLMERVLDSNPRATVILWYPLIDGNKYRFGYIKNLKEMVQKKGEIGHYNCWVTVQKKGMQGSTVFIANPTKEFDDVVDEECMDWLSAILLKVGRSDYCVEQWMKKPKK